MRFAATRFYPVDETNKIVYRDSQATKSACADFLNCTGVSGDRLNRDWKRLTEQGFKTKRLHKDPRGGAGRGQGRPKNAEESNAVKLRLAAADHDRLKRQVVSLRRATGRVISIQDYGSKLILEADLNAIVPEVQSLRGDVLITTINPDADAQLEALLERIKSLRQDVRVSRGAVFGAIVRVATGTA
jgi:hypothetical protein